MRRPIVLVLSLAAAVGSWLFFREFPTQPFDQWPGWINHGTVETSTRRDGGATVRPQDTILIATFNIQVFGRTKAGKPHVMDTLANIARRFDVIAIQEIRSMDQDIVPRLVDHINAASRQYDYVIGPRLGRSNNLEQYAFVFDRGTVEVDRHQLYTVDDRQNDLLHREPLVGCFRTKGPDAAQAFTFTLVNIHIDPDDTVRELNVMDDVYRAVRDDGRGEDDVIILGDFNADSSRLGQLGNVSGMTQAVTGIPTNTRGTAQYDNIVFHRLATVEFTGRSGVLDFMREFNFTMEEALEVSDHLPVWAEFSVYEGGQPGRIALRPDESAPK